MKFLCVNCDEGFDFDGEGRPRCPKCMRVNGIREATVAPVVRQAATRKWLGLGVSAVLLAGAIVFAVMEQQKITPGVVASAPLSGDLIERQMKALGIVLGDLHAFLDQSDAVRAFAEKAATGKQSAAERASAVVAALRERANKRAFVPWSQIDPRDTLPMTPEQLLAAMKDGAALQLYPLEVATLATVALRSLDVSAMVAEIHAFEGDRAPVDPSGRLGYFGVAVLDAAGHASLVLDPYGGRTTQPKAADFTVLNDLQTIGAALNLRALCRALRQLRPAEAVVDAKAAVKLTPRSPSVRGGYAAVALSNGGVDEGEAELQAAAQLRRDSPRRNNLAVLFLAKGDVEAATKEIAQALSEHREFAAGHATLASIYLATGEREPAFTELKEADRIDPELPNLALLWSHYFATQGDLVRALEKAEQGVARRPNDAQAHLMLGRIYRENGQLDQMRRQAQRVLELVPTTQRAEMEQMVRQLLGPTALDQTADDILGADDVGPSATPEDLDLSQGSKLLGGPAAAPAAPAAPSEQPVAPDGPLLMLGDPSKLHLAGPGGKLQLKLDR
jgi:tetratricopeptide (TPR) repeat protein